VADMKKDCWQPSSRLTKSYKSLCNIEGSCVFIYKTPAMNRILRSAALLLVSISCFGQPPQNRGEFANTLNGLMYSDNDMKSLRFIVDSLNLRFKTCDLDKIYYAKPQTRVYYVSFRSAKYNLKDIVDKIENKVSFTQLITDYSSYINRIDSSELFIQMGSRNSREGYTYLEGNPGRGYSSAYWNKKDKNATNITNDWIYDYSPKDKYSDEYSLTCRYFPEQWKQPAIPEKYGRLILYVDCMIDTSASVFLTDRFSGGWRGEEEEISYHNLRELADYLDMKMSVVNNNKNLRQLHESQVRFAANSLKNDNLFRNLLSKTIDDYVNNKTPQHDLESLATQMEMHDKALLMKRCYRVMGSCSQDSRPREHARDIAVLAAQAHSWDIFLRAHLDIMNDRFARASDGSYAWGERKTYLKELEELNLNIVDLMLGLTLRAQNVADNHYYGTIWRMGWALTESKEKALFEEKAILMMKDDALDEFNRGLIFLLYKTYISYLDEKEAVKKRRELRETMSSFPLFIQHSIKKIEEQKERRRR
jgi:hypothetical protein